MKFERFTLKLHSMKSFGIMLRDTFNEFLDDNGIKLSAALSYYTIFSIPPLLIIIIRIAGIFFGEEAIEGQIYAQIDGMIGKEAALQIQQTIQSTVTDDNSYWATTVSIIALLLGATGVITEIQGSINIIWGLRTKPRKGFIKLIINRLISISMVVGIGFLMMVSLLLNALLDIFSKHLQSLFPDLAFYFFYVLNLVLLISIITVLFSAIFMVLPDAKIKFRTVIRGAFFTALLFMIGKLLISLYLGQSEVGTTYGAAGSVIIILVWVYYSSMILFFGAEFTQVYADHSKVSIVPNSYAEFVPKTEKV